jgi:hypothetical protein
VAAVVVLATLFVAWVVWAALGATDRGPQGEVTAFRIESADSMRVRVRLAPGTDRAASCTVQALDRTREVVGVARVGLQPGRPGAGGSSSWSPRPGVGDGTHTSGESRRGPAL